MCRITWKSTIILCILFATTIKCSKLNVPRVLLPVFNDFPTKFTLETEGGCYKWSTTRTDIVQIELLEEDFENECAPKALITTVTKERARNIAVVLAEEIYTKQLLRCDVIVDAIHSISISTTTKELFLDEAPEKFEIAAHDEQGNDFTSLEGVEFDWTISSSGLNKDHILRYLSFRDSLYDTPPSIEALEIQGKKGSVILFEGIKTGSAKVAVRLDYLEYSNVEPVEVQLMVVANLLLTPNEVYMMPGDVVTFRIFYLNNGRLEEIALLDSQYYIEPTDTSILSSVKKSGAATALKEGATKVVLRDRNVADNDPILNLPSAWVHVVKPHYLAINVMPFKNWAILAEDPHEIVVEVYSSNDHKLIVGPGVQIILDIGSDFVVTSRSTNGSWAAGFGAKQGLVSVEASLVGVYSEDVGNIRFDEPIVARGELLVYPRITITPPEVILPWNPLTMPKYDVLLVAKGGDGKFLWTSSDNSLGVVSQTGQVHTTSKGVFSVSAAMMRNHHNRQTAKFMILPPTRLEIVEFIMETEIGNSVHLQLALYANIPDKSGKTLEVPFTRCQDLPFEVKISDDKFEYNRTYVVPPIGSACGNLAMVGKKVGASKITVTYFHDGKALEDSVTVSAYKPLVLLQPEERIVLAVGSSLNLVYSGGPRPFVGRNVDFQKAVVSDEQHLVQATDVTEAHMMPNEDVTVVQVLCRQLGETTIKLMISNTPVSANCKPQFSSILTQIICGKPRRITLQPDLQIANPRACPMDLSSGSVIVQGSGDIKLIVDLYDNSGYKFLNFSSLLINWIVAPLRGVNFQYPDTVGTSSLHYGTVEVALTSYQLLRPSQVASLVVNATVVNYRSKVIRAFGITPEDPVFLGKEDGYLELPPIRATLQLILVNNTNISPDFLVLYNHPRNVALLDVVQGSGFFEVALNNKEIADVEYFENSKQLSIKPKKSGMLTIHLTDLCLMGNPAITTINVVSVGIIRTEMIDKVEIHKSIKCVVLLFDENDNLMDIPSLDMINILPVMEKNIANIRRSPEEPSKWGKGEIHFVITGMVVGDTKLTFKILSGQEEVVSSPVELQVFNPLRLHPRNGTLLVLSKLQFDIRGGPQPEMNIVYDIVDDDVADVDDKAVVTGRSLGYTKIIAKAVGVHPVNGETVVYSQDEVQLHVVALTGIKIVSPLTRFKVGSKVLVWCEGLPDISPLVLGTIVNPPIIFNWHVEDNILANLSSIVQVLGIDYGKQDRLSMTVQALREGKTRLSLNVTVPAATANVHNLETITFHSFVDLEVFQAFYLLTPPNMSGGSLLMSPFSSLQLQTNLDKAGVKIEYFLPNVLPSTELVLNEFEKQKIQNRRDVVTLSSSGLVETYGVLGSAIIKITATDHVGMKQDIHFAIEVKSIHYMTLQINANWRMQSASSLEYIPVGTKIEMTANFHDDMGSVFHAGPKKLKVRKSLSDLIQVKDSIKDASVWIYMKKPGFTTMKFWADGVHRTAAYWKLHVEESVKPVLDYLTSGDIVCLWTPLVDTTNIAGSWKSNDLSVLTINPSLDIVFAQRDGQAVLTHSLMPSAPHSITVLPVTSIEFLIDESQLYITNGQDNHLIRFPLVLHSEKTIGYKANNLVQGWRCGSDVRRLVKPKGFNCFMQINSYQSNAIGELFNITTSFVPETGQYACEVVSSGLNGTDISRLETNFTVWAEAQFSNVYSRSVNLEFIPGFYVEHNIEMVENGKAAVLEVVGLPKVLNQLDVHPADSNMLWVEKQSQGDDPKVAIYHVQLLDYHWRLSNMPEAMGIIVSSQLTSQEVTVMLRVSGDVDKVVCTAGRSPILKYLQNNSHIILMSFILLLVFLITFFVYSSYMQPIVQINRSLLATPTRTQSPLNTTTSPILSLNSSRLSGSCGCTSIFNCSHNQSAREPIYGDASTFYNTSTDFRTNRRGM